MSVPQCPKPCSFYAGFIWSLRDHLEVCIAQSETLWGPVLERSGDFHFGETAFYEPEMGPDLMRTYCIYERPLEDSSDLIQRKLQAACLERSSEKGGRRTVNLDPGYLNGHQVVVATFKDYAHRIHLGRGIYAHLEYIFKKGEPVLLPWTYPDFRRDDHLALFKAWRKLSKRRLQS